MKQCVDLNCDIGESFGNYQLGHDADILDLVTSANIACGFHAGDPATMRATVKLALQKGVAIGAHPGLPDLVGFGRREMKISPQETRDLVTYQIGALAAFVKSEGGLQTASEVFADRTYEEDGSLTPRTEAGSTMTDGDQSVQQVLNMIQSGTVRTRQGTEITVRPDTICIHGDGPHALDFVRRIRIALRDAKISVKAI